MSSYFEYWDELKESGDLIEYEDSFGIMIDNKQILKLTRAKLKLRNPNNR